MASAEVGIGILETARMRRALMRHPSLARRLFTDEERRFCEASTRPAEHYAARFAARVAVLKALDLGFGHGVGRRDVWVSQGEGGRPQVMLEGLVRERAAERGVAEVAISLSFTHDVATAMALLVTEEVRPQPVEERDPQRELLASFKAARSVLDELDRLQGDVSSTLENPT